MNSPKNNIRLKELRQLCQEVIKKEQRYILWKQQNDDKVKLRQKVQKELRELQISIALAQLDLVATHEFTDKVSALVIAGNNKGLRDTVIDSVSNLEQYLITVNHLNTVNRKKPDMNFIERSVKTISILIDLLDSLEC